MKKVIFCLDKKFKKDSGLIAGVLGKLDRLLKLKGKYVEIYLVNEKFNVKSFLTPKNFPRPEIKNFQSLGEIYLSPDFIKKNKEDLSFMLIHGLLHLLGYDHKKEGDRIKMNQKEQELWRKIF